MNEQIAVPSQSTPIASPATAVALRESLWRVFFWMTAGLALTALVAMGIAASDTLQETLQANGWIFIVCVVAQFAAVIAIAAAAQKMSPAMVSGVFLAYSALTGVTFSLIFTMYTKESLASTFFITAGTFGAFALFGAVTKRDLTAVGSIAFMGLIGFLIATIVNIFLQSSALLWITTFIGIAVFVGLTAYDMQKIKRSAAQLTTDGPERERWAVFWALQLYLDFINLFLLMLRIFGGRR